MQFLEPTKWSMIVMDGDRPVAKARKMGIGWWLLTLNAGCWIDKRAREPMRDDLPKGFNSMWSMYPQLLAVKTTREARSIMKGVANTGRKNSK